MKAFIEKIQALLAEQPEQAVAALAEIGYIPGPAAGAMAPENLLESEAVKAKVAAAIEEAAKTLKAGVIAILEMCALAGMEKLAIGFIREGTGLEDARTKVLEAKAAEAGRTHIRSTVGALSTGEESPVVADAKARAGQAKKK